MSECFDWRAVKVEVRDSDALKRVTSAQLRAYAAELGYRHCGDWRYSEVWRPPGAYGAKTELLILKDGVEVADCASVQATNVEALAEHTGLSQLVVLEKLSALGSNGRSK